MSRPGDRTNRACPLNTADNIRPDGIITGMEVALLWLLRIVAVATVLPAFFVTWYLSGSDGTAKNPVAPLLGIGVMITAVWSAVTAFRTLEADPTGSLLVFAGPPALMLVAWPFSGNDAVEREPFGKYVVQVLVLCGPLLLGLVYGRV